MLPEPVDHLHEIAHACHPPHVPLPPGIPEDRPERPSEARVDRPEHREGRGVVVAGADAEVRRSRTVPDGDLTRSTPANPSPSRRPATTLGASRVPPTRQRR